MISDHGADLPACTQPAAIFAGEIIPVNQLNPFDVVCCELYDAAYSVRSAGANSKLPKMRPDTNSTAPTSV